VLSRVCSIRAATSLGNLRIEPQLVLNKAQDADEQNQNPHRKPFDLSASNNCVEMNKFQLRMVAGPAGIND
jgi:hypothetical protein